MDATNPRLPIRGTRPRRAPVRHRSAYTLVELLLVLAVIGALAAVAWPSVLAMRADHELSSAAEQVRMQIAAARTRAIQTGVAFQFRYEPKGRQFTIVPFEAEPETAVTQTNQTESATMVAARHRFAGEVPKNISFVIPTLLGSAPLVPAQKLADAAFRGLPNAGKLASVSWSGPVIFATDGTSQDTVVTLGDKRGHRIDIVVRGLTGAAAVSLMRKEAIR